MSTTQLYKCDWCGLERKYMAEPEEGKQWRTLEDVDFKVTTWGCKLNRKNMFGALEGARFDYCSDQCLLNALLTPDEIEEGEMQRILDDGDDLKPHCFHKFPHEDKGMIEEYGCDSCDYFTPCINK
jgi:hypothetical protein